MRCAGAPGARWLARRRSAVPDQRDAGRHGHGSWRRVGAPDPPGASSSSTAAPRCARAMRPDGGTDASSRRSVDRSHASAAARHRRVRRRLAAACVPAEPPQPRHAEACALDWRPWASPPPACAGCARPACCATWCARPSSPPHLVYPMFVQLGRQPPRSRRCPASSGCRSRTPSRRPARRTRSACPPYCCSGSRPRRTSRPPAPTTTRASSSSPSARSRTRTPSWS